MSELFWAAVPLLLPLPFLFFLTAAPHCCPQVSGIPVLEPSIMTELFWAIVPHLMTVHPLEEWVQRGRGELAAAISRALEPVREYLALYNE